MLRIEANGKQIKHIVTNHPMTDDEAYALVGEIINDEENERVYVVIDGVEYEYDDLSTTRMPTVAEMIAKQAPWCDDWEIYKVRKDACNDNPLMSCFGIPNEEEDTIVDMLAHTVNSWELVNEDEYNDLKANFDKVRFDELYDNADALVLVMYLDE